jgi:acetyl esterase/lipase
MPDSILDRPAPPADRQIPYGADPLQFADLRRPAGSGPHLAAITIHGGFWRNRYDLTYLGHLCEALAARGIATWNLEYRRMGDPGGGWPGTFHDIAMGARYLFDHAEELGVDAQRVIVLGHSAGGHLASWLASMERAPVESPIRAEPLPLRGAVPIAGVLDLERCHQLGLSDDAVGNFLGGSPATVPERYAAASPVRLVPSPVAHLLIHGTWDENVPIELSEGYQAAATRAGGTSALMALPRADHFDVIDPESKAWPSIEQAIVRLVTGSMGMDDT